MEALSPERYKEVYNQMNLRIESGQRQALQLIQRIQNTTIRDRLVPPQDMEFVPVEQHKGLVALFYRNTDKPLQEVHGEPVLLHRHALAQLCNKVGFPLVYLQNLRKSYAALTADWPADLLAHNLNTLFHKTEFKDKDGRPRFLHRLVGNELRGFLSRRYNRHMASEPLLEAFVSACTEMGASPVEAISTHVKHSLKCVVPMVFEPIDNYPVALGVDWSNSDFGAGRLQVSLVVFLPGQGRCWILDNAISRVHIGSVLEDSDLEVSDETARKEVAAQRSAVRDAVHQYLHVNSGSRILQAIADAHTEGVAWHTLRSQLNRYLTRKEVESVKSMLDNQIEDLPPVKRVGDGFQATTLWAMAAISKIADQADDGDRKLELQRAAGSFLKVKLD